MILDHSVGRFQDSERFTLTSLVTTSLVTISVQISLSTRRAMSAPSFVCNQASALLLTFVRKRVRLSTGDPTKSNPAVQEALRSLNPWGLLAVKP